MSTSSGAALRWRPEDEAWDPTPFLQGDRTGHGRRLIFDIEGNDLLSGLTTFWCIAAVDIDTGEEFYWGVDLSEGSLAACIEFLGQASLLLAHNGIGYDYPAIEKLYPRWVRPAKSWDTQVIAKVVWPYARALLPRDHRQVRSRGSGGLTGGDDEGRRR